MKKLYGHFLLMVLLISTFAPMKRVDAQGESAVALPAGLRSALLYAVGDADPLHESYSSNYLEQKVVASDGTADDFFGWSVALSGDTALVGVPMDDNGKGSAYIFVRGAGNIWTQQAKLTAPDRTAGDAFGVSVALSGNTALVGVPADDSAKGAAYIFVRDAANIWRRKAKLIALDRRVNDGLGFSVALSGNTALLGTYMDDNRKGSAYVFVRSAGNIWTQQAKLIASDRTADDFFGWSVALSGDTALVGAPRDDMYRGSAYIFVRNSRNVWRQRAKLTASDGAAQYDQFGQSVALSEDAATALVGAPADENSRGSAYVFIKPGDRWQNMTESAKLNALDGAIDDGFGISVDISNTTILVGAGWADSGKGSAYVFAEPEGGWSTTSSYTTKLTASDGAVADDFGLSVALSGDTALVGAFGHNSRRGSAYFFQNAQTVISS